MSETRRRAKSRSAALKARGGALEDMVVDKPIRALTRTVPKDLRLTRDFPRPECYSRLNRHVHIKYWPQAKRDYKNTVRYRRHWESQCHRYLLFLTGDEFISNRFRESSEANMAESSTLGMLFSSLRFIFLGNRNDLCLECDCDFGCVFLCKIIRFICALARMHEKSDTRRRTPALQISARVS